MRTGSSRRDGQICAVEEGVPRAASVNGTAASYVAVPVLPGESAAVATGDKASKQVESAHAKGSGHAVD